MGEIVFSDAIISQDGIYRYTLARAWDYSLPSLGVVMLNPSTADAANNDATIRELLLCGRRWGYGAINVRNLFAFRATRPEVMMAAEDPVGPENDKWLTSLASTHNVVLCAWGGRGGFRNRDKDVVALIKAANPKIRLVCLGYTSSGHPYHPLGVTGPMKLEEYKPRP